MSTSENNIKIHPFVLSGGSGTRLWPLSRKAYPKQFLPLEGERSLLQQSCLRVNDPVFAAPSILCNHEHRFLVAEQMRILDQGDARIVLEPVARNTAPAALIAALLTAEQDEDGLALLMPSDHVMSSAEGFVASIKKGVEAANGGKIVTFGVRPDSPETGYGYIETENINTENADTVLLNVSRFVEKPNQEKAEQYLAAGNFFWNAGIFLYSAKAMVAAFETHAPDMLAHCRQALAQAKADLNFLRLDEQAFAQCENISIDYAIIEKSNNISCVPLETGWNDLGAWSALWDIGEKDSDGNITKGDVLLHDTTNSYVHSDPDTCLSLIGLDDVIAVSTRDAVLVAPKAKAQDVKHIVDKLQAEGRDEHIYHKRVYRPWGWYESLAMGPRYQVKCLMVKPGVQLSLQSHHHRAEHWIVVSGTVNVTVDDDVSMLTENQSTYIPIGSKHRLGNPGKVPALLIEVQSGAYLGEDDIVRYEDDFDRAPQSEGFEQNQNAE